MLIRVLSVTLLLSACASFGAQPASPPTTKPAEPATQPSAAAIDPSTPKGALRAFAKASRTPDSETLKRVSKTDTADELENTLIAASNDYQKSVEDLAVAMRNKWGDSEARRFIRNRGMPMQAFFKIVEADLDEYDVEVQGDSAELVDRHDPKTETNIKLVREDGVWKVTSTGLTAQWGKEVVAERVGIIRHRTEIVAGFAEDVAADKYGSVKEVGTALGEAFKR